MRNTLPELNAARLSRVLYLMLACAACDPDPSAVEPADAAAASAATRLDAGYDAAQAQAAPDAGAAVALDAARDAERGETGPQGVEVPRGAAVLFPLPGAKAVCVDAALRIRFGAPPVLGSTGRVRVFEAGGAAAVAEVDMAKPLASDVVDGVRLAVPRPAYVDGDEAVFYLPRGSLEPGRSYSVTLERGTVSAADGTPFSLDEAHAWSFETTAPAPRTPGRLSVALDGSGDFCSIQSAIDAVPAGNNSPVSIELAPGTYHEILRWKAKSQLTLRGRERDRVIVAGTNNEKLNPGTAKRALIGIDDSRAVVIEDLTIRNLTPQDGSQAEALRMQNCDQCIVRRARVESLQDTLLWSGRIYAQDCYIEGNVDYVWGTGTAYFDRCELHTKGRKGYIVQARNPAATFGYVFVGCRLTADPGIQGDLLARIDAGSYPASHVAFVDCEMGSHIAPSGWLVTGASATQALRFWEYGSTQPGGRALDVSGRLPSAKPLSSSEAETMRNPAAVLGGWNPN